MRCSRSYTLLTPFDTQISAVYTAQLKLHAHFGTQISAVWTIHLKLHAHF